MALPDNPITRKEAYLAKIAGQEVSIPNVPITREEAYLDGIAKNGGGGGYILPTATADRLGGVKIGSGINVEEDGTISANGGGGTSDYPNLTNKPQINSVELSGNKTAEQLGLMGSLEAGNYIDITAGVISVTKEKGEYSLERYVLQSTGGGAPKLVVKKYIDSELISTNEYMNNTAHVNIDDTLEIWYSYNPYDWHYKLLVDGVDHSAGYEYEFSYTDTTEYPVDFHIAAGDSTDLVTKSDLTADNIMMSDGVTSVEDRLENPLAVDSVTKYSDYQHIMLMSSGTAVSDSITLTDDCIVIAIVTGAGTHSVYYGKPTASTIMLYPPINQTDITMMALSKDTVITGNASSNGSCVSVVAIPIDKMINRGS